MAREIRVELVQNRPPRVRVDDRSVNMRGLGRALIFLVFLRGVKADRTTMARALWPEESEHVASNRLRVTLTRLRSLLGASFEVNRSSVRLIEIDVSCDLWEEERKIREALDEIDLNEQLAMLTSRSTSLRSTSFREVHHLSLDRGLAEWDEICRSAICRTAELAALEGDWNRVDLAWHWMRDRGDLLNPVCERFLDANLARGTLGEGIRIVKRAAQEEQLDQDAKTLRRITLYGQQLQARSNEKGDYDTSHFQTVGNALLSHLDRCANGLAEIMSIPEVQLKFQATPEIYISILEGISGHLAVGEESWVRIQSAKLAAFASLYDYDRVIETCHSLFPHRMAPLQETVAWMHYSFSHFQLRHWEEAFTTITRAQEHALNAADPTRFDICKLAEGSYLWHIGKFELAREIYDQYLEKHANSEDFTAGVNRAICYANYAIIELVFGDLDKAKHYAELAYSERQKFDLSRHLPLLLALLSVIKARDGDLDMAIEHAVESMKLTYQRGSSREGQINMEWICGVMVVVGQREEAWQILTWVNNWRKQTRHVRSVCETRFVESLQLHEFSEHETTFFETHNLRDVMRFQIKCLRRAQTRVDQ